MKVVNMAVMKGFDDVATKKPTVMYDNLDRYEDLREQNDNKFSSVSINDSFRSAVFETMPNNYSTLEMAVYTYIKMCKLLTFEGEVFSSDQQGSVMDKLRSLDYISTITPENNAVVCYQFSLMYSKFLSEMGVDSERETETLGAAYGDSHESLKFTIGKHMLSADSVVSILNSDMLKAKENKALTGLVCESLNKGTQKSFSDTFQKVYKKIVLAEMRASKRDAQADFAKVEDASRYIKTDARNVWVPFSERANVFVERLSECPHRGMDAMHFALSLFRSTFTLEEKGAKAGVLIVRENLDEIAQTTAPKMIVSINKNGFDNLETMKYYALSADAKFEQLDSAKLQKDFEAKKLEYLKGEEPRIPGLDKYSTKELD